jgi:hypothetical protein
MFAPLVAKAASKNPVRTSSERSRSPGIYAVHEQGIAEPVSVNMSVLSWEFDKIPIAPAATAAPADGHAKLAVGRTDDLLERGADRMAAQVMQMPESDAGQAHVGAGAAASRRPAAPSAIPAARSAGQRLGRAARDFMEPRFGFDFSQVRIHADDAAARSAEAFGALAYSVGTDIVFGRGRYAPETWSGRHLLAHELAHVVQGNAAGQEVVRRQPIGPKSQARRRGIRKLAKGTMEWSIVPTEAGLKEPSSGAYKGDAAADVQISFTPDPSYRSRTVTFIQTKLAAREGDANIGSAKPKLDVLREANTPFYGAEWDAKARAWAPESGRGRAPAGFRNAPSTATDPNAYMYDAPAPPPGRVWMFESVAVVAETGEVLGALRWGVGAGGLFAGDGNDCTDKASAEFGPAVERFSNTAKPGSDPDREEHFDAVVVGFMANDGVPVHGPWAMVFSGLQKASILNADQESVIDPIVARMKADPKLVVEVGGFADITEVDPFGTSSKRAEAVKEYLVHEGVAATNVRIGGFGASWARRPSSTQDSRNRRVQLRFRT